MNSELIYFFTIFVALPMVILIKASRQFKTNNSKNLPPGPWKLPIIGNMHQLVGSLPHQRLTELARKYGPIMHLQLGQLSQIVVSSPDIAKEVLKTHDLNFASRPFNLAASIIAYNARDIAFCQYGDYWRQLRKICTLELLSTKRVQSFRSIREQEVSHLIRSIALSNGTPVNLCEMTMALSYCITSRAAFGRELRQREAFMPVVQKILNVLGGFGISDLFPSFQILQIITGMRSKLQKIHEEVDAILEDIIRVHREKNKSQNMEADDLIDVLLNLQDSGKLDMPLAKQDIKAVILDMFLAGNETSSSVIEWAMSELIRHPEKMEKAQAEVRRVFDEKETVDETNLHDLRYLNLVIKETLRLHPPAPLLVPREAEKSVEIWGYNIPQKTQVMINAWAIARDPNYWTDPESFYPERFLNSSVDYKGTNFEFIPFGAGRRICPGSLYGMSIVELVLANLLYHFDWKVTNGKKPEDLDMSEASGATCRREKDLCLIPITHNPLYTSLQGYVAAPCTACLF